MLIVPLNLPSVPVPGVPPHTAISKPTRTGNTRLDRPRDGFNIRTSPQCLSAIEKRALPPSERPIVANAAHGGLRGGRRALCPAPLAPDRRRVEIGGPPLRLSIFVIDNEGHRDGHGLVRSRDLGCGSYVTCFRGRRLNTAGARWAGTPEWLP